MILHTFKAKDFTELFRKADLIDEAANAVRERIAKGDCERDQHGNPTGTHPCPLCTQPMKFYRSDSYNGHLSLTCPTPGCTHMRE